jgi:pimeloyl-ACP methyl ester carboxylesterase
VILQSLRAGLVTLGLVAMALVAAPVATVAQPAVAPRAAPAPSDIDGDWWGALTAGETHVRIGFHIHSGPDGKSTLDSPDQGARGLALSSVTVDGSKVRFELGMANAAFEGERGADKDTLNGHWTQRGGSAVLVLHRGPEPAKAAARKPRPQDPAKPYPYREEQVGYDNAVQHVHLAGTLTLPEGKGPFAVVLLITGSGAQDRDETILGHKLFWVLADSLSRRGVAVLRVDDRGVGGSTGTFPGSTTADFVTDAQASIAYLRSRPDIDPGRIGLIGHSEGAVIGPIIAADDPSIAFVVMMAGTGVPGRDILLYQQRNAFEQAGAPKAFIERTMGFRKRLYAVLASEVDQATALEQVSDILGEEAAAAGADPAKGKRVAPQFVDVWSRWFANFDPATALRRVRVPVLVLNGSKDTQVPPQMNLPAIRAALAKDKDVTVIELPGLNHLFQTAGTGQFDEYETIDETIAPVALKTITDWVVVHAKR